MSQAAAAECIVAIEAAAYSVARDRGVDGRVARLRSSTREIGYDSCYICLTICVMSLHTRGTRVRSAPPSADARAVAARARAAASLARRPPTAMWHSHHQRS